MENGNSQKPVAKKTAEMLNQKDAEIEALKKTLGVFEDAVIDLEEWLDEALDSLAKEESLRRGDWFDRIAEEIEYIGEAREWEERKAKRLGQPYDRAAIAAALIDRSDFLYDLLELPLISSKDFEELNEALQDIIETEFDCGNKKLSNGKYGLCVHFEECMSKRFNGCIADKRPTADTVQPVKVL